MTIPASVIIKYFVMKEIGNIAESGPFTTLNDAVVAAKALASGNIGKTYTITKTLAGYYADPPNSVKIDAVPAPGEAP